MPLQIGSGYDLSVDEYVGKGSLLLETGSSFRLLER